MALTQQNLRSLCGLLGRCGAFLVIRIVSRFTHQVIRNTPHAIQEAVDTAKTSLVPIEVLIGRSHKQNVGTDGRPRRIRPSYLPEKQRYPSTWTWFRHARLSPCPDTTGW